ncbi:hypothetical protein BDZ89DRAFT_973172 [Hymenopellis radicata]|nr:hypothetical protein BDZ89DRAFT_973172 [Hymenopellis radicata]
MDERLKLLVHMSTDELAKWLTTYQDDPIMKRTWESAASIKEKWVPSNRFFKDADGLLFFCDADYHLRLCIPKSLRWEIMIEAHKGAMDHAHLGSRACGISCQADFTGNE